MGTQKELWLWAGLFIVLALAPTALAAGVMQLDVALDKPVMLAGETQKAYLRVGLMGCCTDDVGERTPVNIAIVLDKSGSMTGEKIRQAKEAAIMAVRRLSADDIVSVVTYDTKVNVLVPATKARDKEDICRQIRRISAGGSTALHGGVCKGAEELKKFLCAKRVNRVILLSDGLANVGPDTPHALGSLGAALVEDGISVTTIGLGLDYNEDLMTWLACRSDGNHYFAENARDLARVFDKELDSTLSVVAQEVMTYIKCKPGIRPVRLLGREGKINGQTVEVFINQLYSENEKFILLEVEVPGGKCDAKKMLASVEVRYDDCATGKQEALVRTVKAAFTDSPKVVDAHVNEKVMVDVVEMIATERNELAVALRDKGDVGGAHKLLKENEFYLSTNAALYDSPRLQVYAEQQRQDYSNLDEANWTRQRKSMRAYQHSNSTQQSR